MRHRLEVIAAALLFSTGGAALKLTTLPPWQVAGFRSLVAATVVLAVFPESRVLVRGRTWLAALAYALTVLLFALANRLTSAASAIFLQATAPAWLMLLSPWLLGEPARRRDLLAGLATAAGMGLALLDRPPASELATNPLLGDVLAAVTGLTWALTVAHIRRSEHGEGTSSLPVVAAGNLLAFAAAVPLMGPLRTPAAGDVAALAYMGTFQVALAYLFMSRGLRHVPAIEASLLVLLEPVMNPVWAWLVAGERPGWPVIAGGGLILGATLVGILLGRAGPVPAQPTPD